MLQKVASASPLIEMARNIKPERGYGFVHLITTGSGERYGPNNNADFFNKEASEVIYPNPAPGRPSREILGGGLKDYHCTFTKYAHVYREHNNSRKKDSMGRQLYKPLGDVVMEAYNPHMDRGELIVKLPEFHWSDQLQKLASGQHVYWSMGCGVEYDTCSECGTRAYTRDDYCDHALYNKLRLTKEGNQIYLYNDKPYFHDISEVWKPADRIAFGLAKVASQGGVVDMSYDEQKGIYMPHSLVEKLAGKEAAHRLQTLEKLAELEKKILAVSSPSDQDLALSDSFDGAELDPCTCSKLAEHGLDDVISETNNEKIMLPPESFIRIVMKKPKGDIEGLDGIREALPGVFSEMLNDTGAVEDGSYTPKDVTHWSGLKEVVKSLKDAHSLEDGPVQVRIIKSATSGPSLQKQANQILKLTREPSEQSKLLAKEYAKYQLGFASQNQKYAKLIVLHNTL
jgi:hypothetical protein